MKALNTIKSLGISLKDLYDNNVEKQIEIHFSEEPYIITLILSGRDGKPDCKLSSFTANIWFRTTKGVNYGAYFSLDTLQLAITKKMQKVLDTNSDFTFKLVDYRVHI